MGAVAEAVIERVENEVAFDIGDRAADEAARRGLCRSTAAFTGPGRTSSPRADLVPSGRRMASGMIAVAGGQQHGAMHGVLELAHIAAPDVGPQRRSVAGASGERAPLASQYFCGEMARPARRMSSGARAAAAGRRLTTLRRKKILAECAAP